MQIDNNRHECFVADLGLDNCLLTRNISYNTTSQTLNTVVR